MKVRNGFVSNSSSSSFIVALNSDNNISWREFEDWLKNHNIEDHEVWFIHSCWDSEYCEGDYHRGEVTKDTLKEIRSCIDSSPKVRDFFDDGFVLIDPLWINDEEDAGFIPLTDLFIGDPKTSGIMHLVIDINGPYRYHWKKFLLNRLDEEA